MATEWTLEMIYGRCTEDGLCRIWRDGTDSGGYPCVWMGGRCHMLRPFVYFDLLGKRRLAGLRVTTKCGNLRCLSEDCLAGKSHSIIARQSMAERIRRDPRVLLHWQSLGAKAKLNPAKAAQIRASARSAHEEAAEHGVSAQTIWDIRRMKTWKPIPANSIFNLGG